MSATRSSATRTLRLSVAEATDFSIQALSKLGYSASEAGIIADHLVDNALCGYRFIAFPRILQMADARRADPRHEPLRVERLTSVSARVHGGNQIGHLTDFEATRVAIEIASEHRFAVVGANDSVTSGRLAYFLEKIAKAGFVGMIFTASTQSWVAPAGGIAAVFGTNPIAFAFPADPEAIVFDIGTSATMAGDVLVAKYLGELLPEGTVIDPAGKPTRDPNNVGAILPFGGHKGYGLALIANLFGILAGGPLVDDRVRAWGALFVAFDPELLMPLPEFKAYATRLVAEIKASPRAPGVEEILIPSERAFRERARRRTEGVEIDQAIYDMILALEPIA